MPTSPDTRSMTVYSFLDDFSSSSDRVIDQNASFKSINSKQHLWSAPFSVMGLSTPFCDFKSLVFLMLTWWLAKASWLWACMWLILVTFSDSQELLRSVLFATMYIGRVYVEGTENCSSQFLRCLIAHLIQSISFYLYFIRVSHIGHQCNLS